MKRICLFVLCLQSVIATSTGAADQVRARREIQLPDIMGYHTLKCDFHMHTVFSDGNVKPHIRVEEAWREGLDAIAITDHMEQKSVPGRRRVDLNRAHEIVKKRAENLGMIVIKGVEMTSPLPLGHVNAIFISDANAFDQKNYIQSIGRANAQGGFVFRNHPGWHGQEEDGSAKWYRVHTELVDQGWLHGIEVVNGHAYYPEAHQWCLEKQLTFIGSSDAHNPMAMDYDFAGGEHRPMTLVFAQARSAEAIKAALQARRSVVYQKDTLIGEARYLEAIFQASLMYKNPDVRIKGRDRYYLQIHNTSQVPFALSAGGEVEEIDGPREVTLYPQRTVMFALRGKHDHLSGEKTIGLPYRVMNLLDGSAMGCPVTLTLQVIFNG